MFPLREPVCAKNQLLESACGHDALNKRRQGDTLAGVKLP